MDRCTRVLLGSLLLTGPAWAGDPAGHLTHEAHGVAVAGGPVLGVQVHEISAELQEHYGAPELGVLVGGVLSDTPAEAAGIEVGDVIVAVGEHPVADLATLREALAATAGETITIEVIRDGELQALRALLPSVERAPVVARAPTHPAPDVLYFPRKPPEPLHVAPADEDGLWVYVTDPSGHGVTRFVLTGDDLDDLMDFEEGLHLEAMEAYEEAMEDWQDDLESFQDQQEEELSSEIEALEQQLEDLEYRLEVMAEEMEERMQDVEAEIHFERRRQR